jgi:hypothetical protein
MKSESPKAQLKRELRQLFRSMDYVSQHDKKHFAAIYGQLGLAWEFLGLQCRHWDGYRRTRKGRSVCRICGKIKGTTEHWVLLPACGPVTLGRKHFPNSRRDSLDKRRAMIDAGSIQFHGAKLSVEVHNGYKSNWPDRKSPINIAADRIVRLWEGDVECWLDSYLVHVKWKQRGRQPHKPPYGAFLSELPKKMLKKFPILLEHDARDRLVGVNILIPPQRRRRR